MEMKQTLSGHILIIDDDPDIRLLMQRVLEKEGYNVDSAVHKEDALDKLSHSKPQLILLDVLLSGADGRELCQWIKSNENTQHVPVIIFSAHPSINDDKVKQYGADDFIAKPLNTDLLLQKVERHLSVKAK